MDGKLQLYTIMPLDAENIDAICADVRSQYEEGVATMPLFMMKLVPEGNPPADKADVYCEKYKIFKKKLDSMKIPSGVLVQASIGHGWLLGERFPYQGYVNFNDGAETNTVCPFDEGFREYIYDAMRKIALCAPESIMVDDDFRTIFRPGEGCGCPLHMSRFNQLSGKNLSREELWASVNLDTDEGRENSRFMAEAQKQALVETAKIMREAVDSVDPSLPCTFCCVGTNAEFGYEVASVLAGKGNPVVIRINNGYYTAPGIRGMSTIFFRAASQIAKLSAHSDILLAETDTCPQNRYSTSAITMHAHFTGSILEGCRGAKHWITRLAAYEPQSGISYRKMLSRHRGFYEALAEIYPTLSWRGCRMPVFDKPDYSFGKMQNLSNEHNAWNRLVLERLGLPQYFSKDTGGITCLEGDIDRNLSDSDVLEILKGKSFIASDTAQKLIARGFGEYLGVDVREWKGKTPTGERYLINGQKSNCQNKLRELVPLDKNAVADSVVIHSLDGETFEELFPGTVVYKNSLGGTVVTFSGTPDGKYNLTEAFSFLNYSRKLQLISLMDRLDENPVYFPGDEEVYMKAADMPDGRLFCAVFNFGFDTIEKLELVFKRKISKIEMLTPDGSTKNVSFTLSDGRYILDCECRTLDPAVLFIG